LLLYKNDLALTLAAYNAGPERVQHYGQRVPPLRNISYHSPREANLQPAQVKRFFGPASKIPAGFAPAARD